MVNMKIDDKLVNRFWSKVDVLEPAACWEWQAYRNESGYGYFWANKKMVRAHRAVWELVNGEIPNGAGHHGTCVLHKCDNPCCVNPYHLFLGTISDNMKDASAKGRLSVKKNVGETHPQAKLSDIDVRAIKYWRSKGYMQKDVASLFGVSRARISTIDERQLVDEH